METRGVEPLSKNSFTQLSTYVEPELSFASHFSQAKAVLSYFLKVVRQSEKAIGRSPAYMNVRPCLQVNTADVSAIGAGYAAKA